MRRILGTAILFLFCSAALLAAKNAQTFYLPTQVQAGNTQIPRGICEVTWGQPTGSQVQLTIKTEDRRTITIPARMVEEKENESGIVTLVENGVTYLQEFRTKNARFILQPSSGEQN